MNRRDLACAALLLLASLLLRLPALDALALNPDESQYEAVAAFVVANGGSEYDRPETVGGGFTVYRVATALLGPYPTRAIRVLVLAIEVAIALLLFAGTARAAGRAAGLGAGLMFQHWVTVYEGFSANREWFALLPIVVGVLAAVHASSPRGRIVHWVISGLGLGAALWFKAQAGPLVAIVPLFALLRVRLAPPVDRSRTVEALAGYAAGGLVAALLYVAPLVVSGAAGPYWAMLATGWGDYVMPSSGHAEPLPAPDRFRQLFVGLHARGLVVLAYGWGAVGLVGGLVARRPSAIGSASLRRGLVLWALAVPAASFAVQLGGRYFAHYYLFLAPAVAALVGLLLGRALDRERRRLGLSLAVGLLAVYAVDRLGAVVARGWPLEIARAELLGAVAVVAAGAWVVPKPEARAWPAVAGVVVLELAMLVVPAQLAPRPETLPHHASGFDELVEAVAEQAGGDDRLFVWGWLPELYTLTGLVPASHHVTAQYAVGDFGPAEPPGLNAAVADEIVGQLRREPPRFIVDASARSWTMAPDRVPDRYDLSRYPEFALVRLLAERYERVGTLDGCVLYRRRGASQIR